MNWKKIIAFLIVLLVAVNAVLFFVLGKLGNSRRFLDAQTIEDAVAVFERRGLRVAPAVIKTQIPSLSLYGAEPNADARISAFESVSRSKMLQSYAIPNSGTAIAMENGDVFEFYSDFGITYQRNMHNRQSILYRSELTQKCARASLDEEKEAQLTDTVRNFMRLLQNTPEQGTLRCGFDIEGFYTYADEPGTLYALCLQSMDGVEIYGNYLILCIIENEVCGFGGRFITQGFSNTYQTDMIDQINILFYTLEYKEPESEMTLNSQRCIYCIFYDGSNNFYIKPCWELGFADGAVAIYDATLGVPIN